MSVLINFTTTEELDEAIIPWAIYNETINHEKLKIQTYFILHPSLLFSFVGYNGTLKLANQLASNLKCGCFYNIPWKTYYDEKRDIVSSAYIGLLKADKKLEEIIASLKEAKEKDLENFAKEIEKLANNWEHIKQ